jgi:hypothetical protein
MLTLLWFILITAFMFFMHRGYGSLHECDGEHTHNSQDYDSPDVQEDKYSTLNLDVIEETEYEEVEEEEE